MRTDAEKQAFAMKCLEIEKAGGDVREYIAKNWPSYTPRATWYNLQREYLKRNTAQLTEGKPDPKREEVNEMRRDKVDLLNGVLKVLAENGDPLEYMRELGYKYPQQAWADLRNWANAHNMNQGRLPGDLKKYYARIRADKPGNVAPDEKPGEHPTEAEKATETPKTGGKIEKAEGPLILPDPDYSTDARLLKDLYGRRNEPSPTCCQPAPPSGVTVPDELPEEPDGYQRVAAIAREMLEEIKTAKDPKPIYPIGEEEMVFSVKKMDSKLGVWEYNREKDLYIFQSNFYDDRQLNVLALTIKDWLNLAAEIPKAIRKMTEIIE